MSKLNQKFRVEINEEEFLNSYTTIDYLYRLKEYAINNSLVYKEEGEDGTKYYVNRPVALSTISCPFLSPKKVVLIETRFFAFKDIHAYNRRKCIKNRLE